ncbi:MAG: hypothetical protein A4E62_02654 [Syntrophorhabdus sp. PtaU1.Bin002]|nr:MAG: hypothetical protein A4E62_02654 [Syntrophorhabdus sp. PtaU1.Bin002]
MNCRSILGGVFSIFLGGAIYLLWREKSLLMFSWFSIIGLGGSIDLLRSLALPFYSSMPSWFYYSLPNALWLFGGLHIFLGFWKSNVTAAVLWCSILVLVAIGSEIGQALHIVPGTFDWVDLLLMIPSVVFASGLLLRIEAKEEKYA